MQLTSYTLQLPRNMSFEPFWNIWFSAVWQCGSVAVWQCGSVVRTQVLGFPALPNGQPHLRAIGRLMQEDVLIKHCLWATSFIKMSPCIVLRRGLRLSRWLKSCWVVLWISVSQIASGRKRSKFSWFIYFTEDKLQKVKSFLKSAKFLKSFSELLKVSFEITHLSILNWVHSRDILNSKFSKTCQR